MADSDAVVILLVAAALFFGCFLSTGLWQAKPTQTDKDTMVSAVRFHQPTGDLVFDDTLKHGLSVQPEHQQPTFPRAAFRPEQVNETLKADGRHGEPLNAESLAMVCVLTGHKARVAWLVAGWPPYVIARSCERANGGRGWRRRRASAGKEACSGLWTAAAVSMRSKLGGVAHSAEVSTPLRDRPRLRWRP